MYSLMGASVYGGSCLNPVVFAHLWKIYVIPRVIYGLEVLSCTLSDVQSLERLLRDMLRRIQSLPRSTATAAVNCLLGDRPTEQELDLRRLTLLCSVLCTDDTLEQDIAMIQQSRILIVIVGLLSATNSCISTIFLIYTLCSNSSVVKYPVSRRSRSKLTAS